MAIMRDLNRLGHHLHLFDGSVDYLIFDSDDRESRFRLTVEVDFPDPEAGDEQDPDEAPQALACRVSFVPWPEPGLSE